MSPTPSTTRVDPDWDRQAACKGMHHLYWPAEHETDTERRQREGKAAAICARCPVIIACSLTYAHDNSMRDAVIAGRPGRERKPRRRTPEPVTVTLKGTDPSAAPKPPAIPIDHRPELHVTPSQLAEREVQQRLSLANVKAGDVADVTIRDYRRIG